MKKYVQITGELEHIGIINSPEAMPQWGIFVKLNVDSKPEAKEVYYLMPPEDVPDNLEKFEPGMYVTIGYYAPNSLETDEHILILADEIFVNEEETMKKRIQFNFKEFELNNRKGILHRQIIETPHHVSDNNFILNK